MSMLTRTGSIIRKDRRRSITKYTRERRGSAPVILSQSYMGGSGKKVGLTRTAALRLDRDLKRLAQVAYPARCVELNNDMTWFNKVDIDPLVLLRANLDRGWTATIQEQHSMSDLREDGTRGALQHEALIQVLPTSIPNVKNTSNYGSPRGNEGTSCYDDQSSSLVSNLQEANLESLSAWQFVRKAFSIVSGTLVFTLVLSLLLILPIGMVSVGATYMNECPVEPKIPVYLLVGGCFCLGKIGMSLWLQLRLKKHGIVSGPNYDDRNISAMYGMTEIGISVFLVVWFVLGNVWVLSNWQPNYTPLLQEPKNWCTRTVYLFAFWKIVACYILFLMVAMLAGLFAGCHLCMVYLRDKHIEIEV